MKKLQFLEKQERCNFIIRDRQDNEKIALLSFGLKFPCISVYIKNEIVILQQVEQTFMICHSGHILQACHVQQRKTKPP